MTRYARRTDNNQAQIYREVRANKLFKVLDHSKIGAGFPDCEVIHIPSNNHLLVEIKDTGKRNQLTKAEKEWWGSKPKQLHATVVESSKEIFAYFETVFKVKI